MTDFIESAAKIFGWRTVIAEWSSIIALFISAYVALTVFTVKRDFLARARVPALLEGIEENTTKIASLMHDFAGNKNAIGVEIAVCENRLRTVKSRIKGRPRVAIQTTLRTIERYRGASGWRGTPAKDSVEGAWEIYSSLNAVVDAIRQSIEDQRLGG